MRRKERENERLRKLRSGHTSTVAKRYKLPERAIEIIEQAGKIHGQQSRAIQIAVESFTGRQRKTTQRPPQSQTRFVGKTYGLPPRTVRLIESLTSKFGTAGNVLAACAGLLAEDLKAGKV